MVEIFFIRPQDKKVGGSIPPTSLYFNNLINIPSLLFIKLHRLTGRLQQLIFLLTADDHIFEITQPGTGRDGVTSDHILLEPEHIISLTLDGGRRQNLRRFLERS